MMVILKIPIAYLCCVVYWAVKAEPKPSEPVGSASQADGPDPKPRGRRTAAGLGRGAGLSAVPRAHAARR
jgi:hypothetical protein